jgi:hypothetical protein
LPHAEYSSRDRADAAGERYDIGGIIDHCCEAWNKLIDQPWRIMTIGRRKWARGS